MVIIRCANRVNLSDRPESRTPNGAARTKAIAAPIAETKRVENEADKRAGQLIATRLSINLEINT